MFKTSKRNFHKEMGFFNASMELFISLLSVAVIAAGGWLIMKNRLNYIDLITFSLYITTFISCAKAGQFCRDVLQRLRGPSPVY